MSMPIYIIGHKNPDTDSICAAIAYAHLKQQGGHPAIPCRAGDVNRETKFVLDYFKVPEPFLITDLKTRAKDLLNRDNVVVYPDVPLLEAWRMMRSRGVKTLPVVDQGSHLLGLVTSGDLADKYLADLGEANSGEIQVSVENILKTLSGKLISGSSEKEFKGNIVIGAKRADGLGANKHSAMVLVEDKEEQVLALQKGAAYLILTGGAQPIPEVISKIEAREIVVIQASMDTFTAARMLLTSVPVGSIMLTKDLLTFNEDDLLDDLKKVMLRTRFRNYPVVDDENRVLGEISRYDLLNFSRKKVILVDHNELSQAVDGADEAQIIEVVDHHRVGGMQTGEPILFRNEPLGSTCTLVAKAYFEQKASISKELAGILCAGILSDTVIFKSPTCTKEDKEIANRLAEIACIEPIEFGIAMIKEGSSLKGRSAEEILVTDLKVFTVANLRMGIGQVNTMGLEEITEQKADLMSIMEATRISRGFDNVLLMVTDLLTESTTLFIVGSSPELIGEAFKTEVLDSQVYLPGVLSRKKQVVPPLVKFFNQ